MVTNVVDYDESLFEYEALTYFNLPKPSDDEIVIVVQAKTISSLKANNDVSKEVTIDDVSLDLNSGIAIVGVVKEKGCNVSDDNVSVGDRVATILKSVMKNTRYAQVPSNVVVRVPFGLDSAEAAAAAYTYLLSFQSLTHNISSPKIRYFPTVFKSKNIFIVDGASTLGQASIQIAKTLGANVFAAGPNSREETIRNLGAIYVGEHPNEWIQVLEGSIHLMIDTVLAKSFKCKIVERLLVNDLGKIVYMGMPINLESLRHGSTASWKCLFQQVVAQTTLMFISSVKSSYYDLFSSLENYPERLTVSTTP
jgi:NADPH:quinone reductase-like Zn-dependent oxidoreductase